MAHSASHYTHWFVPMTGGSAEKHDSFLSPTGDPPGLADARQRFAAARGRFLVAASKHLGVMEYAGQRLLDQAKAERADTQ
jgi:hypothetical protein